MSVILVDLAHPDSQDPAHSLQLNWWNWRPIVEILRSLGLFEEEMLERMGTNAAGGEATEEQARAIARHLRTKVLPPMPTDARVQLDLKTTTEPDDFKMHYGKDVEKNYGATVQALERFAAFCETCAGFSVC